MAILRGAGAPRGRGVVEAENSTGTKSSIDTLWQDRTNGTGRHKGKLEARQHEEERGNEEENNHNDEEEYDDNDDNDNDEEPEGSDRSQSPPRHGQEKGLETG
ncbi:hypothetical protein K1719_038200 [Acacia pycnantha]|nr:hypothetical protein K1719_038200 [Acacia pycnantha]